MTINDPLVLILILIIPLYIWYKLCRPGEGTLHFPMVKTVKQLPASFSLKFKYLPLGLCSLAMLLIIISLARPQRGIEHTKMPTEGIDIVLAIDVSTSMLAEDFILHGKRVNRLTAVKPIVREFIDHRLNDCIGLVIFAGMAYTQCPLTLDYGILFQFLDKIKIGMIEDGTAIGSAIAICVNRLRDLPGKSKVIILLTDGRNNTGKIDPLTAAEIAKTFDIKIYTVGAGSRGPAPYPVQDIFGNKVYQRVSLDLDEDTLTKIAQITGGKYFRATNTNSLREIYDQIDQMEKTESEIKIYMEYKELFPYFLIPGLCLLIIGLIITQTCLRKLP